MRFAPSRMLLRRSTGNPQRHLVLNELETAVRDELNAIVSGSRVLVGGYLSTGVPTLLLKCLSQTNCRDLTLITNASLIDNAPLRALCATPGKVSHVVTSLEHNRHALDASLVSTCQLSLLNSEEFALNYCSHGLTPIKTKTFYALVHASIADQESGRIGWHASRPTYFNDVFATAAHLYAIAQVDQTTANVTKDTYKFIDSLFVKAHFLKNTSFRDTSSLLLASPGVERIAKRLVLEFENEEQVYLPPLVHPLIARFYMPRHLRINLLNDPIDASWPSGIVWRDYAHKLSLCVVHARSVDAEGFVALDNTRLNGCRLADVVKNAPKARLIAIMNSSDLTPSRAAESRDHQRHVVSRRPEFIITEIGVFRFNQLHKRLEMVEHAEQLDKLEAYLASLDFQLFVDKSTLKVMTQQHF